MIPVNATPRSAARIPAPRRAFTLIELLVVVGIIAILAAIAVPNFLEAQTRAKVSRVRSDLRTLATGIEAYSVDNNRPPKDTFPATPHIGWASSHQALTTPISYLTSVPADTFQDSILQGETCAPGTTFFVDEPSRRQHSYDYCTAEWSGFDANGDYKPLWLACFGAARWETGSCGPDKAYRTSSGNFGQGARYDPTNGTVSEGDIYRSQALTL